MGVDEVSMFVDEVTMSVDERSRQVETEQVSILLTLLQTYRLLKGAKGDLKVSFEVKRVLRRYRSLKRKSNELGQAWPRA